MQDSNPPPLSRESVLKFNYFCHLLSFSFLFKKKKTMNPLFPWKLSSTVSLKENFILSSKLRYFKNIVRLIKRTRTIRTFLRGNILIFDFL